MWSADDKYFVIHFDYDEEVQIHPKKSVTFEGEDRCFVNFTLETRNDGGLMRKTVKPFDGNILLSASKSPSFPFVPFVLGPFHIWP